MFSVGPMIIGGGVSNNTAVNPSVGTNAVDAVKELFTQEQLQGAAEIAKQGTQPQPEVEVTNEDKKPLKKDQAAKIVVKDFKEYKSGNVRFICKVETGKEDQIVVTKNGVAAILQKGIEDKMFEIVYNEMQDGAWWCTKATQL